MPVQKETIHLAIGPLPHHITTHFFNQQSSHFKYGNQPSSDSSDLILDPNVDFQEGIGSLRGEPTFFPRQVVIDFRQNFGTEWEAYNVVVDDEDDPESGVVSSMRAAEEVSHAWGASAEVLWAGDTSGKIQSTRYVSSRDDEEDDAESFLDTDEDKNIKSSSVQHLTSDVRQSPAIYSHNPSHPRSKYPLPRLFGSGSLAPMGNKSQEGQTPLSSFEMGMSLMKSMDQESSFMDENVRWYAENSDLLQSFNLYSSISDGFSGIAHKTLEMLTDEYPKIPVMAWGASWGEYNEDSTEELNVRLTRKARLY